VGGEIDWRPGVGGGGNETSTKGEEGNERRVYLQLGIAYGVQ